MSLSKAFLAATTDISKKNLEISRIFETSATLPSKANKY